MESIDILKRYGVGRRKLDDDLFVGDQQPSRLGVYGAEEHHCHTIAPTQCSVPGCNFTTDSIDHYEKHYNCSHRYSCSQCKNVLPSPHLLDLHVQEQHDSFFAVVAAKKPSYACYTEECNEKFVSAEERLKHCIKIHKLPKNFRYDYKPREIKCKKNRKKIKKPQQSMEIDQGRKREQMFSFTNNKQKGFIYTGKKFTKEQDSSKSINMDVIMTDLKDNLPQS